MSDDKVTFTEVTIPAEQPQDVPADDGPHCVVCGTPLEYGGRGRKPRYCDEHKKSRTTAGPTKASTAKNERLAAQATDALLQINGLVALLAMVSGLHLTAEAFESAKEGFREQVHSALISDPELAASILKAGSASAKVSLIIAYGMLGATVIPVAVMELKAKRLEAAERAEQEQG